MGYACPLSFKYSIIFAGKKEARATVDKTKEDVEINRTFEDPNASPRAASMMLIAHRSIKIRLTLALEG
ncbi:MAG: hypothetical protein DRO05_06265 [Thermoproteota archaeon]|nr:MAG: hypothetical protein DRO05_06265 [Candidatus Korarchaeota archaeon]